MSDREKISYGLFIGEILKKMSKYCKTAIDIEKKQEVTGVVNVERAMKKNEGIKGLKTSGGKINESWV